MRDSYGRIIDYMRLSVTEECNLSCCYCRPREKSISSSAYLSFPQIEEIVRVAVSLGIVNYKITGGEPLLRPECSLLIRQLKQIHGLHQVTLTTNGILLTEYLENLIEAGLDCVNISLNTLRSDRYEKMSGVSAKFHEKVLKAVDQVLSSGIPLRINTVLIKDVNEEEWYDLTCLAQDKPLDIRFIEMMPLGLGAKQKGIANWQLKEKITARHPDLAPVTEKRGNGPAEYWHIPGWAGNIGFISAVHERFCHRCNRIRLSATGRIKSCLCYSDTVDISGIFREKSDVERTHEIEKALRTAIRLKPRQHCFSEPEKISESQTMNRIGG